MERVRGAFQLDAILRKNAALSGGIAPGEFDVAFAKRCGIIALPALPCGALANSSRTVCRSAHSDLDFQRTVGATADGDKTFLSAEGSPEFLFSTRFA